MAKLIIKARFAESHMWDCPLLGPLTDKAIVRWARLGKYGPEVQAKYSAKPRRERKQITLLYE